MVRIAATPRAPISSVTSSTGTTAATMAGEFTPRAPSGSRSPTTRPACAAWSSGCWRPEWPGSGSNAPTAGRGRAAPGRADRLRHRTRPAAQPALAATARPATKTTGSTPTYWPMSCAPTGAGCATAGRPGLPPPRCARLTRAAKTSSATASPWPTSCARTCRSALPPRSGCSDDIDSDITLRFLERFPTAERAAWLSVTRLTAWLSSVGYCGRTPPETLYQAPDRRPGRRHRTGRRHRHRGHHRIPPLLRTLTTQIESLAAGSANNSTCTQTS